MKRALFTMLAILALAAPAFAQATDVAGDWDVTIVSPQGPNTTRLSLKQNADKLDGMFKSPMGELPVKGTVTSAPSAPCRNRSAASARSRRSRPAAPTAWRC